MSSKFWARHVVRSYRAALVTASGALLVVVALLAWMQALLHGASGDRFVEKAVVEVAGDVAAIGLGLAASLLAVTFISPPYLRIFQDTLSGMARAFYGSADHSLSESPSRRTT